MVYYRDFTFTPSTNMCNFAGVIRYSTLSMNIIVAAFFLFLYKTASDNTLQNLSDYSYTQHHSITKYYDLHKKRTCTLSAHFSSFLSSFSTIPVPDSYFFHAIHFVQLCIKLKITLVSTWVFQNKIYLYHYVNLVTPVYYIYIFFFFDKFVMIKKSSIITEVQSSR